MQDLLFHIKKILLSKLMAYMHILLLKWDLYLLLEQICRCLEKQFKRTTICLVIAKILGINKDHVVEAVEDKEA
jgi:hypothetical protein